MLERESVRPLKVLSVGHVTHDRYGSVTRAGGSAFFGAQTMRSLGAQSLLATVVGSDFERRDELCGLGVSLEVRGETTTFENRYPEGRARVQRISAVAPPVLPERLPNAFRKADVLFLAPVAGEVELAPWLAATEASTVGLGIQGLLKAPGEADWHGSRCVVPRAFDPDPELLRRIDVVFLSEEDLTHLASPHLLEELRRFVPIVVVTRGALGSRVFHHGREDRVGTFAVSAKDPTGAGDTFAGAFLFALAQGLVPVEAARLASAAASIVVEAEAGAALDRVGESYRRAAHVPVFIDSCPRFTPRNPTRDDERHDGGAVRVQ
jgi:hypothetical protein